MQQVKLRLFGMPVLEVDGEPLHFENRKVIALLAFLAVTRQAHTRERIAALLWPDVDHPLPSLRTTLWELRKKTDSHYLNITNQVILLNSGSGFWGDVIEFAAALQGASEAGSLKDRIELLQFATDLYQGDFMAGFSLRDSLDFDDWQLAQTTYFQRLAQRAFNDLIALYQQTDEDHYAIQTAERLRMMDRLAQEPVEILMRLYQKSKQRQPLIQLYEEYRAQLQKELNAEPDEALKALYQAALNPTQEVPVIRPGTAPLGNVSAIIFRSPETVVGLPRRLVGRDDLIAHTLSLLRENERVMLSGMGGIGKTSTAAKIASEFIRATGQPVIWLETGRQESSEILLAIARAFDQQQSVLTKADPAAFVMQLLAAQNGLLVLDNCWNGSALFEVLNAVPNNLPVLLTSRQRIPIDGEVLTLDALSQRDATQLLAYHARRELPDDAHLAALLSLLGNHPYALEIAGKQLKAQPGLSLKDLRARYMKGTREIAAPGGQGRHSIENIISTSVEALSADAQTLLTWMGGLALPRASLELLALILNAPTEALEPAFAELEQSSLIIIAPDEAAALLVYHLHDLTFSYCRDRFRSRGADHSKLVSGAGEYMRLHSREVKAVELEFTNLLGAVRVARQLHDDHALIDIIRAIMQDGYFDAFGYTPELLDHLNEAIRLAQNAGVKEEESLHYLLSKYGDLLNNQSKFEEAFRNYLEALPLAPSPQRRALLAFTLGTMAFRLRRDEYRLYVNEAEAVARSNNIEDVLSRIVEFRGHIALNDGDFTIARQWFEEAVQYTSRLNDPARYFYTIYNLAFFNMESQNFAQAERGLEQAYQLAIEHKNELWKGACLSGFGRCANARGERDETVRLMTEALQIYERTGNLSLANWVRNFLEIEGYVSIK